VHNRWRKVSLQKIPSKRDRSAHLRKLTAKAFHPLFHLKMASSCSSIDTVEPEHRSSSCKISSAASTDTSTMLSGLHPTLKAQVIERAYVDRKKLVQKLRNLYGIDTYGNNNFKVQVGAFALNANPWLIRIHSYA
jgi:hypothetical protein